MLWVWRHRHAALFTGLIAGALIIGWLIWQERNIPTSADNAGGDSIVHDVDAFKRYRSERFGFAFFYPKGYYLDEREVGDGHRYRTAITLTEDTEENRLVREGAAPPREGPTAITIDVFQNNLDKTPLTTWVTGTSFSNYKLAREPYKETSLAGSPALRYVWDGLYQGESVVLSHKDNIIMLSVTYLAPEDQIRKDFETVLSTFERADI